MPNRRKIFDVTHHRKTVPSKSCTLHSAQILAGHWKVSNVHTGFTKNAQPSQASTSAGSPTPPQSLFLEFCLLWLQPESNGNTETRLEWILLHLNTAVRKHSNQFPSLRWCRKKALASIYRYPKTLMPFSSWCPKAAPGTLLLPPPHQVSLVLREARVQ